MPTNGQENVSQNCDPVFNSVANGCVAIRETLVQTNSTDPLVVCCIAARYNICVQGVKTVSAVHRSIQFCLPALYDDRIEDLETNTTLAESKELCKTFESKSCVTEPVKNFINKIQTNLNAAFSATNN